MNERNDLRNDVMLGGSRAKRFALFAAAASVNQINIWQLSKGPMTVYTNRVGFRSSVFSIPDLPYL
jgi:hypothetical protein